jgi:tetratricopeptide (TPR) repeat protein
MQLGELAQAARFYERGNAIKLDITKDWYHASMSLQYLAKMYAYLGRLTDSIESATYALELAGRIENKQKRQLQEQNSLAYLAWTQHLQDDPVAEETFQRAMAFGQLQGMHSVYYADYLLKQGNTWAVKSLARAALDGSPDYEVSAHFYCMLAKIETENAAPYFSQALQAAYLSAGYHARIRTLYAYGLWLMPQRSVEALAYLKIAFSLAVETGYVLYENNLRKILSELY